jgi:DNA-binding beta-propeller fold protein YncE
MGQGRAKKLAPILSVARGAVSRVDHQMKYCIATLLFLNSLAAGQESSALSLKTHVALPNVDGRMDHFSVDIKGQRLFSSALGNNTVEVIDLQSGQRVRTLTGLAEPQGLFYDASTNRLYAANGADGATKIFDGATFQLLQTAKFSDDADNIRYDARSHAVIVGYGGEKGLRGRPQGAGALGILDSSGKLIREIVVDAHPESFQLEKTGTRVFVNVPDKQIVQVADFEKGTILARWPTTLAKTCFPMALDEAHHRLFIGCRAPGRLLVFDTESGQVVASPEIVGDTDDLFYDPVRSRIYVIGGQGFIDVLQQKDPDHYERIARYATPPGTRAGLFVPELGRLFAAVPHRGEQRCEILSYEVK